MVSCSTTSGFGSVVENTEGKKWEYREKSRYQFRTVKIKVTHGSQTNVDLYG